MGCASIATIKWWLDLEPRGAAGDDGVGVDEEFAGAGDEGGFVRLAALLEAAVEGDEGGVPAEGGGRRAAA